MSHNTSRASAYRLFLTNFLLPTPMELIPYFFTSLLVLLFTSRQTILIILADGSPVTPISTTEVIGQRFDYIPELLAVPILGRIVLFLFWLGIGSIVYMLVWLFQNLATEVYDSIAPDEDGESGAESEDGWWGTTLSHTIFMCSGVILLALYIIIVISLLLPAWTQLFQIGLQSFSESGGFLKTITAIIGAMVTVHGFVLFFRMFIRTKNYIYNNYY